MYLIIAVVGVIAVAVLLEMQYEARRQLRNQSDAMGEQSKELEALEIENIRLSNIVVRASTPLADEELAELRDLRQEVERLRRNTNEVATLQTEIRQLRSALSAVGDSASSQTPPEVPASDVFPRDSWTFAGYDTPENTIQSLMWAVSQGDPNTYAAGLTSDMQAQMQPEFDDGTFAEDGPLEMSDVTGYRIVDRDMTSDTGVTVTVFIDGENELVPIMLEQGEDGWRVAYNGGP